MAADIQKIKCDCYGMRHQHSVTVYPSDKKLDVVLSIQLEKNNSFVCEMDFHELSHFSEDLAAVLDRIRTEHPHLVVPQVEREKT